MLNNLKKVPNPGYSVLHEALNLIAGLGSGDKNLKKMLEEMKEVQQHNEEIVTGALAAKTGVDKQLADLKRQQLELANERGQFAQSIRERNDELRQDEVKLEKDKTDFSDRKNQTTRELDERSSELNQKQSDVTIAGDAAKAGVVECVKLRVNLAAKEKELSAKEGNLYAIQEYLKAHL